MQKQSVHNTNNNTKSKLKDWQKMKQKDQPKMLSYFKTIGKLNVIQGLNVSW